MENQTENPKTLSQVLEALKEENFAKLATNDWPQLVGGHLVYDTTLIYSDEVHIASYHHPTRYLTMHQPKATTKLFWNCGCEQEYARPHDQSICLICGCQQFSQPNSSIETVEQLYGTGIIHS